ncbi:MAG: hypothetical protein KC546_18460, partial [Anaerolineae bacterium]|nr:hypothetical protein [Anaerolineae bacterium]
MKTVRFAFYVMSFVFLFSLLGMSAYAQDEVACTESNPCPATVILVVDDFAERIADDGTTTSFLPICDVNGAGQSNCENIPETWCRDSGSPYCQQAMEICSHYDECNFERLEEIQDKLTCSVSINGQNDVIIDGSPGLLTTAFRPFKPHGYYVVGLLEDLLADRLENRYLDDFTKPTGNELFASADLSWMTNIQFWEHTDPNNHKAIVVVEVDTKGFESRLIVERIATSINLFLGTPDAKKNIIVQPTNPDVDPVEPLSITVENIIINASFAVIPCGDFPSLSLDEYITNLVDVFAISDDELCPLIEETLNSFETLEGVTCDDILGGDVNQVLDTPEQYDALIKVLTGPDINDLLPQNE